MHPEWPPRPPTHPPTNDNRQAGVPRRFGIGSIMVVTAAFALLFYVLKFAQQSIQTCAFVTGFVAVVGISQAVLFGGRRPREASIIAGCVYLTVSAAIQYEYFDVRSRDHYLISLEIVILFGMLIGIVSGYLTGILIGGVFMFIEAAKRRCRRTQNDRSSQLLNGAALGEAIKGVDSNRKSAVMDD